MSLNQLKNSKTYKLTLLFIIIKQRIMCNGLKNTIWLPKELQQK